MNRVNIMSMKADSRIVPAHELQSPKGVHALCSELSLAGHISLKNLSSAIQQAAPKPGALVYVHAKMLSIRINGLEPVIFTAIDASTHLKVAQGYLAETTAAAISFVEFAAQSFPFAISEIKTPDGAPFHEVQHPASHSGFSEMMNASGWSHSLMTNPMSDTLFSILKKMCFGGTYEGLHSLASSQDFQRELGQFLFFHNNYRSVPWFGGKTPLQRLRSFDSFSGVHAFGSCGESNLLPAAALGETAQSKRRKHHSLHSR